MEKKMIDNAGDVDLFAPTFSNDSSDPYVKIRELCLEDKVAELDYQGYTIVTPNEFNSEDLSQRLLDTALNISEKRRGVKPDLVTGRTHQEIKMAGGEHIFYALLQDPIFEEALLDPVVLAMITYLLGESCILSSMSMMIRGPGAPALGLHSDMMLQPSPFPYHAQVANITWALTDYSPDGGAVCFWPGSHKLCRRPTSQEISDIKRFEGITAPAGSLVIWHGNTWHGSFERKLPGLRVNLIMYFARSYLMPQEWYRDKISNAAIERNKDNPRFTTLMGLDHSYPFGEDGPNYDVFGNAQRRSEGLYG